MLTAAQMVEDMSVVRETWALFAAMTPNQSARERASARVETLDLLLAGWGYQSSSVTAPETSPA